MRGQERDDFFRCEASIAHAGEDLISGVRRLRDGQIGGRTSDVRTTGQELETRTAAAIRDTYGTSELNAGERLVSNKNIMIHLSTYKSAKETLCLIANGLCSSTISSTPSLASVPIVSSQENGMHSFTYGSSSQFERSA